MALMTRVPAVVALVLLGAAPLSARAISVDCSDPTGSCTVSNDGMDFVSCECTAGPSGGGGGGNAWAGLSDEQLYEACLDSVDEFCGAGPGTTTADPTGADSGDPTDPGTASGDTGDAGDTGDTGDTQASTSGATDDAGGSGDSSDSSDSGDSGSGTDAAATGDTTAADTGGSSGGGDGSSDDGSSETSASAGDASATAGDASATEGDGTGGTGSDGPGEDILRTGCGCRSSSGPGGPLAVALGMLLGALSRRRRLA